ncbi:MAG: hypothetical protein D3906_05350 [Candidatus Electrothrix sp. AUS1_2]|nr:hypothetical protein [Candidatus Electrothrix sp. AUS1_2]
MKRQHAINLLSQCKRELKTRFGVTKLLLFGSTARDTADDESDIDIMVAFDGPVTSKRIFSASKSYPPHKSTPDEAGDPASD